LDRSFAMRECKIVDVSTAGVRLAIPFAGKIPETFTLLFSKGAQGHRVRVIWRHANQDRCKICLKGAISSSLAKALGH
jgi:hypothetical protein